MTLAHQALQQTGTNEGWFSGELLGALIGLAGVLIGWLLALLTDLVRQTRRMRRLRAALLNEMRESRMWLLRNQSNLMEMAQLLRLRATPQVGPMTVPTHIYDTNYAEIAASLGRHERVSYNSIYANIGQLNSFIARLDGGTFDSQHLLSQVVAQCMNIGRTLWMIRTHEEGADVRRGDVEALREIDSAGSTRLELAFQEADQLGEQGIIARWLEDDEGRRFA